MSSTPFRVAAVQMCSGTDPERTVPVLEQAVAQAAARGAIYVQTPEMTGAVQKDRKRLLAVLRREADDPVVQAASALARKHAIHLHLGSTPVALDDGKIANRAFVFAPSGDRIAHYDKLHMYDVDLDNGESWRESAVYQPGDDIRVLALPFARLGLAICYDLRFPALFRAQALAGAEILTVPAAFTRQTGEAHWHILQRARAIENGAFVVAAAQGGRHADGRETYGHSLIVDPWGRVLAEAAGTQPEIVVAEICIDEVAATRAKIPNLKNARPIGAVDVVEEDGLSRQERAMAS